MDRCGCGGTYVPETDGVTTEAGGIVVEQMFTTVRCDACGHDIADDYEADKRRAEDESRRA
jgi:hypothetical protein